MIVLDRLTKRYGAGAPAVSELSLEVVTGEVCVLIGPSGCGKSTTLRMINRLVEPTSGKVWIDGEDATKVDRVELRRRIGYVIQNIGLFPHLSVADNVATVPRLLGWPRARINTRVEELLTMVNLDPHQFGRRWPHELSGGQRQRVGFARALGADPPVLLMDEPFGAIDPITRTHLQDEFLELQHRLRKTVVLVTHDLDEAIRLGDRVALLRQGGYLEQYATPGELMGAPASPFVAAFVGADRNLRRLGVVPLKAVDAEPTDPADSDVPPTLAAQLPAVKVGDSFRDAMVAVLGSPTGQALVLDDTGESCGLITAESIQRAARRSLVED